MTQARKGRGRRPIRHMVASKAFYDRLPPGAELLMLSPMVMAMRLPMVLWELSTPQFSARRGRPEGHRAVFEKAAAEGGSGTVEAIGTTGDTGLATSRPATWSRIGRK